MGKNERSFYDKLKDIFLGVNIEGNSGFVNLMRIKSSYFDVAFREIEGDLEERLKDFPDFREELYDRLNTFFSTYFSESGSIYFSYTPLKSKVYDRIYTQQSDVILFWKTRMLYYVKTDKLWRNLRISYDKNSVRYEIEFDVSNLQQKSGNEKKEIIYEMMGVENKTIKFAVLHSERGKRTPVDRILTQLKERNINLDEDDLDKIFRIYERQNDVDYFINKDAKSFLKEQFDLWLKNYIFDDGSDLSEKRIRELKLLKEVACEIIDFVSQFEDELVRIWNKPKFVLNSNYVISLDRIVKRGGIDLIRKLMHHPNFEAQVREWRELGIIGDDFNPRDILTKYPEGETVNPEHQFLPIDTKYFKDLETEILSLFDNLDEELDGWLIHSENYQALNTLLLKFRGKVQTIYIDPPFNKEQDADYFYTVKYKDSSWATMLENRITLARQFLRETGSIFVRCDYNGDWIVRPLMDEIFGRDNFRNEIVVTRGMQTRKAERRLLNKTDTLFFYSSSDKGYLKILQVEKEHVKSYEETLKALRKLVSDETYREVRDKLYESLWMPFLSMPGEQKDNRSRDLLGVELLPPKGRHWAFSQESLNTAVRDRLARLRCRKCGSIIYSKSDLSDGRCRRCGSGELQGEIFSIFNQLNNNWTDIPGYEQDPTFPTRNSEILMKRVIESTSNEGDIVMDFFLGSGTTTAVAHKLKRKWIGVEMGDHFYSVVLPRMKKVLAYDGSGISKEKDVKEKYNEKNAGGFFKYYDLEQYEQTLRKCHYIPSEPFLKLDKRSIFQQYVFMKDPKLLDSMELDYVNNRIKVDFDSIYPNIDLAETLSLMRGKRIKKIERNAVVLEGDERVEYDDLDFKLIKPLIWW